MAEEKKSDSKGRSKKSPGYVPDNKEKEREDLHERERGTASRSIRGSSKPAREPSSPYLGTYTVQSGDSLSAIALNYYGSAAHDKWMAIYEANKDVIGDNPNLIFPGQELKIPNLDE